MRWLAVALILVGATTAAMLPVPDGPHPGPLPEAALPPTAVCPVEEGSGRSSSLGVLSTVDVPVSVVVFGGGEGPSVVETVTGPTGAVTIPAADLAAVGRLGALVETTVNSFAAGFTVVGTETFSGEACFHRASGREVFLTGGSTVEGQEFELHLMNPYSGEAVVDLVVQSESGRETNQRFESLVVPARGSTLVDLTQLIPSRNTVSVTVETVSGSVSVMATQRRGGESAAWRAIEAGADWYLPIPGILTGARITLATPINAEIDYQVDLYGPDGLFEAWQSGTLGPRGQATVDLGELAGTNAAIRVVASGPLVPTLWADSPDTGLAVTTATPVQASTWLLPGATSPVGGSGSLILVNTGVEATVATVRTIRDGAVQWEVPLGVDEVAEVPMGSARGYRVDSDGSLVAMWVARRGSAALAAMGVPLEDG